MGVIALGIEEHESLVESESVVVRRGGLVVVARDSLGNEGDETDKENRDNEGTNHPEEDLVTDDNAAKVHILLFLLLLLGLIIEA